MKQITINIYKFNELSDDSKKIAIEKLRDINVSHEWYDFSIEDFTTDLKSKGFNVDTNDIQFDLSYCQGNGLCFDGNIDKEIFLKDHFNNDDMEYMDITINKNNYATHYNNSKTRYIDIETSKDFTLDQEVILLAICKDITDLYRQLCDDMHDKLQKEYEYLQSDQAIIETIEANDYDFLEDGSLY